MKSVIYKITSPNGKSYIGITKHTLVKRWRGHVNLAKRDCGSVFHAAIRKYRPESFKLEVLVQADWGYLVALEPELILHLGTRTPLGYNVASGGEGALSLPPEIEALRARRSGEAQRGKTLSVEHREKLSRAHAGRPLSAQHCASISKALIGKPFSDQHRANLVRIMRTDWYRAKMSRALTGKTKATFSIQHRANLSKGLRASWARRRARAVEA